MAQPTSAPPSTQIVTADQRTSLVQTLFKTNMQSLQKSVPRTMGDPNRLIRIAFNAIAYDDKLRNCTQRSLLAGVIEALKLGLMIGGPMQECWLIPFNVKGKDGQYHLEATFITGYQGLRILLDRAKAVMDLQPQPVYMNDEFDCNLAEAKVTHRPWWLTAATEPGPLRAAYAVAHLRGGGRQLVAMPRADIDKHRARSRAANDGPWVTDYDAMALKTVVRVLAKYLPKQSEVMVQLAHALELDAKADAGESQLDIEAQALQVFDEEPSAGGKLDSLKAKLGLPLEPPSAAVTPVVLEVSDAEKARIEENTRLDAELFGKPFNGQPAPAK
jgi:recombination protein RecT